MRRNSVSVVAASAAVMLLAACGGGGGSAKNDRGVEDQLGFDDAGMLRRQARAENIIRDCMMARGFDYVPVDPVAQRTALVGAAGLSPDDFEKQFGYGIVTLWEKRREQALGGPNETSRAALSDAERASYDRALLGENLDATFADALDTGDYSRLGGCTKEATADAFGGVELLSTITSKLDELDQRIFADARMIKAINGWAGCMRAKGYDFRPDPQQVDDTLLAKLQAIVGAPGEASPPGGEPNYDTAALDALGREEVIMVAADLECEGKHISDVEDKVRKEYERSFRDQNAELVSQVPAP